MKFKDREKFLSTVAQWIRDGSEIVSFSSDMDAESVVLRGTDGAMEYLTHWISDEDYDHDDALEGD
jgi:hypothetical protein